MAFFSWFVSSFSLFLQWNFYLYIILLFQLISIHIWNLLMNIDRFRWFLLLDSVKFVLIIFFLENDLDLADKTMFFLDFLVLFFERLDLSLFSLTSARVFFMLFWSCSLSWGFSMLLFICFMNISVSLTKDFSRVTNSCKKL